MFVSVSQSPKAYPVRHALRETLNDLAYTVLISPVPEQVDFFNGRVDLRGVSEWGLGYRRS